MVNILYEPESIREDYGILVITEGEPCKIPFHFEIISTDAQQNTHTADIKETDIVEYTIKQDVKLVTPIIQKRYNGVKNNVSVLSLTAEDMNKLCGGRTYVMSAKLLNSDGELLKVLIRILQIRIQEVV